MPPTGVIERDSPCRDDAVDMRMGEQILAPGVENAEDADLRAQVLGIGRNFQQGGGAGREQEMVRLTGVVLRQEVELVGNGEDHVKIRGSQQFLFPCCQPALTRLGLALWAVPVAAGNGELSITCLMGSFF